MDNSLIPRAFSPTDAKRRAEENARDAERRSSARNTSSAAIPAGGTLDLEGKIAISGGGGIDVLNQGAVTVTSDIQGPANSQYTITAKLGNLDGSAPGIRFTSTAHDSNSSATLQSSDGQSLIGTADTSAAHSSFKADATEYAAVIMSTAGNAGHTRTGYGEISATPGTFLLKANDANGNSLAKIAATSDGKMVLSSAAGIDIQGTLTQNGSPISGGGGAVSSVAGKTGAVTLVKADVGLDQVDNTSDLNKPVSTATQTALNGKVNTGPQHAEFTLTASVPTGGPLAAYTVSFTADAANTTGTAFTTTPAAGKIGLPAGTYAVHHYSDCGASMGTGAVLAIQNDAMTKRFSSLDVVSGSYNGGVNHPCIYLPTSQNLTFSIAQFSGVTRTANVRIYLEKIK